MEKSNRELVDTIESFIKMNIAAIITDKVDVEHFSDCITIESDCDIYSVTGHYEGEEYLAPEWYYNLVEKSKEKNRTLLIIKNIDKINKQEQLKFKEILKYRKVSEFKLPDNVIIILPIEKDNYSKVCEVITGYAVVV